MIGGPMPAPTGGSLRRRVLGAVAAGLPRGLLSLRGPATQRRVALTFDDGPDPMTRKYLDVLDSLSTRATFFVVGQMCEKRRDDLLEIVRRGHEVASHGYSHQPLPNLSRREIVSELERTALLLPPPMGARALFRPPRGATSMRSLLHAALAGYATVLWSLDSDDCRTEKADDVVARLAPDRVRPGEIVLLHEGQQWTLEALPTIVSGLRGAGFELVTASELLGL